MLDRMLPVETRVVVSVVVALVVCSGCGVSGVVNGALPDGVVDLLGQSDYPHAGDILKDDASDDVYTFHAVPVSVAWMVMCAPQASCAVVWITSAAVVWQVGHLMATYIEWFDRR